MYSVIKLENVTKNYKNLIALDNLSLEIQKGGVIGFIGHSKRRSYWVYRTKWCW